MEALIEAIRKLEINVEVEYPAYHNIGNDPKGYSLLFADGAFSIENKDIQECSIEEEYILLTMKTCMITITRRKIEIFI